MTEPKTRRAMCVVTTIKLSHEVMTVSPSNDFTDLDKARSAHAEKVGPILEALRTLGVDVTDIGPALVSRMVPVEGPPEPAANDGIAPTAVDTDNDCAP